MGTLVRWRKSLTVFYCLALVIFASDLLAQNQIPNKAIYKPGEVIVKLKGRTRSSTSAAFIGRSELDRDMKLQRSWQKINMHHFKTETGETTQEMMARLESDPAVEYVEPNYILYALGGSGSYSQSAAPIQAEDAWGILSATTEKPIVAVIDTGVDYNHSVFTESASIWTNSGEIPGNGIDDDGNGFVDDVKGWNFAAGNNNPMDDQGHGTHVAGLVLGAGQDILNVSPLEESRIQIMPLKFLASDGSGSTDKAVEAIYYAVDNGAKVLNNSWGGHFFSAALYEATAYAYEKGVSFVAAAGNNGADNDSVPLFPASFDIPNVISVAASTEDDDLASFSNYGSNTVHLASPGQFIRSTLPSETTGFLSGTSMAAPIVAGAAALILHEQPEMLGYQIKTILTAQVDKDDRLQGVVSSGGRLNIYNSVLTAQSQTVESEQPHFSTNQLRASRDLASVAGGGGGCGLVHKLDIGGGNGGGPGSFPPAMILVILTLFTAPLFVARYLRKPDVNRRKHKRYEIDSDVTLNVGGRRLRGQISSISEGGAQVSIDDLIEKGSIINMSIARPDGEGGSIEVQGHVVWNEEQKKYGVQFSEGPLRSAISEQIRNLTYQLKPEKE